jgi:hypothetical protein
MLSYIPRVLTILLVTSSILLLTASSSELHPNRTRRAISNSNCRRVAKRIEVSFDGCEPGYVDIETCDGHCGQSLSINTVQQWPNSKRLCNCCKAVRHSKPRAKKVMVRCGPQRIFRTKRVFVSKLKGRNPCGCRECVPRL